MRLPFLTALLALAPTVAHAQLPSPQLPPPQPPPSDPAQPQPTQPGLTPPAPVELPPQDAETYRQLEQAEREDSGRGLEFVWIAPDVGFQWVSLDALSSSDLVDDGVGSGSGPVFGGTAGLRWLFYTAGARFRYGLLGEFSMWSLGGDLALRVPLGNFEPYGVVGASYVSVSDFATNDALRLDGASSDLEASGIGARLGGGFDYYLTPVFSTGVSVDAEALFLSRDAIQSSDTVYAAEGSSVGLAVTSLVVLGLHF